MVCACMAGDEEILSWAGLGVREKDEDVTNRKNPGSRAFWFFCATKEQRNSSIQRASLMIQPEYKNNMGSITASILHTSVGPLT
ncbi:MAG: hypothetical protein Kow00127_16040 [Bacteroidales bacterium]